MIDSLRFLEFLLVPSLLRQADDDGEVDREGVGSEIANRIIAFITYISFDRCIIYCHAFEGFTQRFNRLIRLRDGLIIVEIQPVDVDT